MEYWQQDPWETELRSLGDLWWRRMGTNYSACELESGHYVRTDSYGTKSKRKGSVVMPEKDTVDQELPEGKDVWHTLTVTIGVRALRKKDGVIHKLTCTDAWKDRPNWVEEGMELVELNLEIPTSFFGYIPRAKGRLQSRIQEEFEATIKSLEE